MIDTHAHLYLPEFDADRQRVLCSAREAGVTQCWLPGIDASSIGPMRALYDTDKEYFRMFAGLHPTEVNSDYRSQLDVLEPLFSDRELSLYYYGVGEIGLDLYWDRTFAREQEEVLRCQLDWAVRCSKPVILHVRNANDEIMPVVRDYYSKGLRGIFHCFSGDYEQARELIDHGFLLGVNGSITYKNNRQRPFLNRLPLSSLVTETDCPYLSPLPMRGRRNEPCHMKAVLELLSDLFCLSYEEVENQTVINALNL